MPDSITFINGTPANTISADDRGLLYGDGVFETMLALHGRLPFWEAHRQRLESSLSRLFIPRIDSVSLLDDVSQNLDESTHQVIKIIVTRGTAQRGYSISANSKPTVIISVAKADKAILTRTHRPGRVMFCQTRLGRQQQLAGIKHLNRLEQILARKEVDDAGYDEGIVADSNEQIIEATQHNFFIIKDNELYTPDLSYCGVEGIMRKFALQQAELMNLKTHIQPLDKDFILSADELFLTNSITGIWPICELDNKRFEAGSITLKLKNIVDDILERT